MAPRSLCNCGDCRLCKKRVALRKWQERNPGKTQENNRIARLRRYGLTPELYGRLLEAQEGVCALCGATPDKQRLAVDHDHSCCPQEKACALCVRGLLCRMCNGYLGALENGCIFDLTIDDSPTVLRYLNDPPAQHVLRNLPSRSDRPS